MAESMRPFRHLCPEADARDAMDDDEFWERVARNLGVNTDPGELDAYDGPDLDEQPGGEPCPACGSSGACGYDSEGRPLIHATDPEEQDG